MLDSKEPLSKRHKGIFLLPSLFTIGALFAAYYSIIASIKHRPEVACIAIIVAMILDGLDGRIARLTQTQTEFGAQLDSLSDMVAFGVAPSILVYQWSLFEYGKIGWLASFLLTVAVALRLARFNAKDQSDDKHYFCGLSSTLAGGFITCFVWASVHLKFSGHGIIIMCLLTTVVVSLLMVSSLPYRSFKDIDFHGKVPFFVILIAVLVFALVMYDAPVVLFLCGLLYVLSAPATYVWQKLFRSNRA